MSIFRPMNFYIPRHTRFDSDAANLVAPKTRSQIAEYYHLSSFSIKNQEPPLNSGILVECITLRHVVAPVAEAEVAGIYTMYK